MKPTRIMHRAIQLSTLASAVLLAACAGMEAAGPRAEATLEPRSGSSVSGTVSFREVGGKVRFASAKPVPAMQDGQPVAVELMLKPVGRAPR